MAALSVVKDSNLVEFFVKSLAIVAERLVWHHDDGFEVNVAFGCQR